MSSFKLTRLRIVIFVACAVLPTFLILHLETSSFSLLPHSFSVPSLFSPETPEVQIPATATAKLPLQKDLQPITNNYATYPRLAFDQPHSFYREQGLLQFQRIQAIKATLFDGDKRFNEEQLDLLLSYLGRAGTDENYVPPRVVLTAWHWVPCAYGACTTGEVQWVRPLIEIMKSRDIIYLYSPWERFHKDYQMLGEDLVTHIWLDDEQVVWCFADPNNCIQTKDNPLGIPPWKMFAFTFWGSKPLSNKWSSPATPWSFNPLGSEWNLVPYQMPEKQFFLGYHYQGCQNLKYIPYNEREDQIIVLAKRSSYYHMFPAFKPEIFYSELKRYTGFNVISNAIEEDKFPVPDGLVSMGSLEQDKYDHLLANSKALLGIGKPIISPTPYASLCRGVPVVLPYHGDLVSAHSNKTCSARPGPEEWCGFLEEVHQHGPASRIGPPYVYTVDVKAPLSEILKVIDTATRTPIEPYEPPEMRHDAVQARVLDYFAIDWERYASQKIEDLGLTTLSLPDFLRAWAQRTPDPDYKKRLSHGHARRHLRQRRRNVSMWSY